MPWRAEGLQFVPELNLFHIIGLSPRRYNHALNELIQNNPPSLAIWNPWMARIHGQRSWMRNVIQVDVAIAAVERVGAGENGSHFAFRRILQLLARNELHRVETVGKV